MTPTAAGQWLIGEDAIRAWLDATYDEPAGADAHRERNERATKRFLQETMNA